MRAIQPLVAPITRVCVVRPIPISVHWPSRPKCPRENESRPINYSRRDVYVSACTGYVLSRPRAPSCVRRSPDQRRGRRSCRRRRRPWTTTDDGKLNDHGAADDDGFVTTRGKFDFGVPGWLVGETRHGFRRGNGA